ncbi:hypothetical protein BU26DRAFT_488295 [Trematosphaeria pertusa]|uniref:Uncharacterized protein n=1 Tax=Trematosphaeria pertusa TaxID=390896 RepID=A0A6A6I953_9PLEO|nr:uncharacterized protein BU26DRAFT_488295 [Trematosphaeria pertusa]KAF2246891.1 hypothetical protein BU26DRAFT_488295 [Trematosphaeria pertusa]
MQLPIEIREMIWEEAIRGMRYLIDSTRGRYGHHSLDAVEIRQYDEGREHRPRFLPSVCLVSKSTMAEAVAVFIRNSTFMVSSIGGNRFLEAFLTRHNSFPNIRSLRFDFFDCFPEGYEENADLALAAKCTGLATIQFTFHSSKLIHWVLEDGDDYDEDGLTSLARPVEQLVERYKLRQLLECKKLDKVIWQRKGYHYDGAEVALQNLGTWVKDQFAEKKRIITNVYP